MLDPLKTAEAIHSDYSRYLTTTFSLRNPELRAQFEEAIHAFQLTKGPYLEVSAPYMPGRSIRQLIADGVLSAGLAKLATGFPLDRPLYLHQDRAITKAVARRNLVIATGTGSGKTECFLFPILDHLVREAATATLSTPGVRALILYPMNALANDQVKRLRRVLQDVPEITFGRYVGETRHRASEAEEDFRLRYPNEPRLPNELISREAIQAGPPHILLTNFAMLEYLLLRPADSALFDGAFSGRWRFFVLDEAHVYDGAKGTEIAMLLRRLKDRVVQSTPNRIQCFATSATLGRGEKDYPDIAAFASRLFAETFEVAQQTERQDVVGPDRAELRLTAPPLDLGAATHAAIADALDRGVSLEELHRTVRSLAPEAPPPRPAATIESYLASVISRDSTLVRVWDALKGGPRALRAIATQVFPGPQAEERLVRFVALGTRGRPAPDDAPVLPARYHLFARALEGAFVCLHPDHPSAESRLLLSRHEECPTCRPKRPAAMFELGACRRCGAEYICGELRADDRLQQPSASATVAYFLVQAPAGPPPDDEDDAVLEGGDRHDAFTLCVGCRTLAGEAGTCACGAPRVPVLRLRPAQGCEVVRVCGACGGRTGGEVISRFRTGTDAPVAVLATTLYQALPPSSDPRAATLIGEGRKLLCFSDSRQDAAFFAPYLERTYGRAIQRRLILEEIQKCEDHAPRLNDLVLPVCSTAESCRVIDPNDGVATNRNLVKSWLMREVLAFDRRQ
ncbi:MAG TPA: DEAD/DEAH box helicase, partial [Dehalococcoidia bacterium]|nr:DEAD/DEAH box helicase [Dehalococcoidia bacterium]